nr:hypothetical protein [Candidatus Pantoea persica]
MRRGATPQQAAGELRGWLADLINQRLMRAPDAAVVNYVRVLVKAIQALEQNDPQLCFRFLYPQVSGGANLVATFSPAPNAEDAAATISPSTSLRRGAICSVLWRRSIKSGDISCSSSICQRIRRSTTRRCAPCRSISTARFSHCRTSRRPICCVKWWHFPADGQKMSAQ